MDARTLCVQILMVIRWNIRLIKINFVIYVVDENALFMIFNAIDRFFLISR